MLSYRHAFHAGNHADVLKHLTLILCCIQLSKKEKPFCYIDTHAGAGMYSLESDAANKNREYLNGIQKLLDTPESPDVFAPYLALLKKAQASRAHAYPGSPWLAAQITRAQDKLHFYELHPTDYQMLKRLFSNDNRISTSNQNGYQSLKSLFPPAARRGITLIDPPYEQESEYSEVFTTLKDGIKRFSTGVYLVWYPLIKRENSSKGSASEKMVKRILSEFNQEQLHVRYIADSQAKGMYGSGMVIINPPWGLEDQLKQALSFLCELKGCQHSEYSISLKTMDTN